MAILETSVQYALSRTMDSVGVHIYLCDDSNQLIAHNIAKQYCKNLNIEHECPENELAIKFANSELKFVS